MSLFTLLFAVSFALAGCSQSQEGGGTNGLVREQKSEASGEGDRKKVTIMMNFKSGSLDPSNSYTPLRAGVVETLVRLDEKLVIKPWLASKWEAINDHTWAFTIRDGVTFQDGTKLDAGAVKASLERAVSASKPLSAALKLSSMEANGQELKIVTTEPHPALPSELVSPYASIISVEAEKKMGTKVFNDGPVGTGPFQVKQFTPNIAISLQRYEGYWNGKAKVEEIDFKFNEDGNVRALALQSKEADIVYQVPAETVEAIRQDSSLTVDSVPSLRVHYLLYNQQKPLVQDVKIRRAFDLLLDRESVAKDIMLGHAKPANGPFHTSLPFGSEDAIQSLHAMEAKKLLEEAGYQAGADGKLSKNGTPLVLQLLTYKGRPELPLIAQILQSEAAKIGVDMDVKMVENIDTYLRENKDWDLVTYSNVSAPRGDGGFYLNSAFVSGGALNPSNLSSDKVNEVIARLNATSHVTKRVQLTKEAVVAINDEVLQSFVVYPNNIVGRNKRVTDWKPGADDYYIVTNRMDVK
ncbi:nickel ABC transporter substrate-binding protein [Brevibacillus choshinensis]|nr:nickel ABC transporter substrate-binding protein [Brevibacillus choshinensis]